MAVTDTEIIDWKEDFTRSDNNTPVGNVPIATDLGEEVRNMKAVVREQMENRGFHWTLGFVPTDVVSNYGGVSVLQFSVAAGATDLPMGTVLRLTSTAGGTLYHRVYTTSILDDALSVTTRPFTRTRPALISSSDARREATPARARTF